MSLLRVHRMMIRRILLTLAACCLVAGIARAQEPGPPPAYISYIDGTATIQRDGEILAATQNMPFVPGDRLRTTNGRVQITFPDGTGIEIAEYSEVECVSPTRVRLIAGTMDHLQRADLAASQSSAYLPQELNVYGTTLDQYGSWQYAAPYGYVWYPAVPVDWRPYYYGYWSPVRSYGWTWIGVDAWAWPTHHYGRWGYVNSRWFWIPGRTWSAAWVSWGSAPGYVSWCPLGFDGRPVFALSAGYGNPWAGWTILPRANFGVHGYYAHRNAIDPRRVAATTRFAVQNVPPVPPIRQRVITGTPASAGIAVPRQSPVTASPAVSRQAPLETTPAPGHRISPAPEGQVPTHYGIAVPRVATPTSPAPRANPEYRPPSPEYRAPAPVYRSPNDYRIQRMDPRVVTPAAAAAPPARVVGPSVERAPAPVAVPRAAPANAPAPAAAPTSAVPAQGAPAAAPPPARSAPPQAAPQGEARPRGQAQARPR